VHPANQCYIYGNSPLYPWGYGESSGMQHVGQTAEGSVDFWSAASEGMVPSYRWQTQSLGGGLCVPFGWTRGEASVQLLDFQASPTFSQDTFVPAPQCLQTPRFAGCRAQAARASWEKLHAKRI